MGGEAAINPGLGRKRRPSRAEIIKTIELYLLVL